MATSYMIIALVVAISGPTFVVGLQDSRITVPTAAKKTAVEQELPAVAEILANGIVSSQHMRATESGLVSSRPQCEGVKNKDWAYYEGNCPGKSRKDKGKLPKCKPKRGRRGAFICSPSTPAPTPAPTSTPTPAPRVDCTALKTRHSCVSGLCGWMACDFIPDYNGHFKCGDEERCGPRNERCGSCSACEAHSASSCPGAGDKGAGCMKTAASEPACVPKVDMNFGGLDEPVNSWGMVSRPEDEKSEICPTSGTGACSECVDKASCWHGDKGLFDLPLQTVKVLRLSPRGDRALTLWTRCDSSNSKMSLRLAKLLNGQIDIFLDRSAIPVKSFKNDFTVESAKVFNSHSFKDESEFVRLESKKSDRHVRVVLHIVDNSKDAEAQLALNAWGVPPYVEQCMTRTLCLDKLRIGDLAFAMRNSNEKQLKCLVGEDSTKTCLDWKKCLLEHMNALAKLIQILRAALPKNEALVSTRATQPVGGMLSQGRQKRKECIDPAISDPEALDCECLHDAQEQCEDDTEDCLRGMMCKHSSVCDSWKATNCETALLARTVRVHENVNASSSLRDGQATSQDTKLVERSSRAFSSSANDLDDSLQGKCAAQ